MHPYIQDVCIYVLCVLSMLCVLYMLCVLCALHELHARVLDLVLDGIVAAAHQEPVGSLLHFIRVTQRGLHVPLTSEKPFKVLLH